MLEMENQTEQSELITMEPIVHASLQYSNHCPELRLVGPAPIVPAYALAIQISIPEHIFQNASVLQNKYREP